MFQNIGAKVKGLAIVICCLGIIFSIVYGIVLMTNDAVGSGLLLLVLGTFCSLISSWIPYCIGDAQEYAISAGVDARNTDKNVVALQKSTKEALVVISKQITELRKMQKELLEQMKKEKIE